MFAIIVPIALAPLIATLFWGQRKAKRQALVPEVTEAEAAEEARRGKVGFGGKVVRYLLEWDLLGLLLLGLGFGLLLIALTLGKSAKGGWKNRASLRCRPCVGYSY